MKRAFLALLGGAIFLAGCGDDKASSSQKSYVRGDYEGRIVDWVFEDYPDESLIHGSDPSDEGYGRFSSKVELINSQKIEASKHALDFGGCDKVVSALFNRRESSEQSLVYMIDCSNGRRLNVSSSDFGSSDPIKSDSEKAISQNDAIQECKKMIAQRTVGEGKVDYHDLLGMSYYKAPNNGNVRLSLDFDLERIQGRVDKFKAQCFFEPNGSKSIELSHR